MTDTALKVKGMDSEQFRFGEFTIDTGRASLTRGGAAVALRPKSFALLEYLVRRAGTLVGKDELLGALWAGVVVTDDSLTRCISEVRAALRDSSQQIIKTVARRGYLFDAPL
ncbi:MAG: transcriptional regulator, partial [Caldimonas sp.]